MTKNKRLSTGIDGLDQITNGGLFANRSYMVDGPPGAGKSLIGLHYLTASSEDTPLYINLEESTAEIETNAANVGIDTEDITFLDLSPDSTVFADGQSYDIFEPSDVEKDEFVGRITDTVESVNPDRVFVDPITRFRHINPNTHQFRQQVVGFMRYLGDHGATVLYTTQETRDSGTEDLDFLGDGTIRIENGEIGRIISVPKFRGSATASGEHVMQITDDGINIYPEIQAKKHESVFEVESYSSGVPEIDQMLHGGIERGTVTIFSGPTGAGKTSLGSQFIKESAGRGKRSVIYLFEESTHTFINRARNINIPIDEMRESDSLEIIEIEPVSMSPQEFAADVRKQVETRDTDLIMIDGIAGYRLSLLGQEEKLLRRMHSLGRYLKRMGVTTILIDEIANITGEFQATEGSLSYLADNIIFLRHVEIDGELRKTIGVLKKRMTDFERTLRQFRITEHGIRVGEPMTGMRGLLTGTPTFTDGESKNE